MQEIRGVIKTQVGSASYNCKQQEYRNQGRDPLRHFQLGKESNDGREHECQKDGDENRHQKLLREVAHGEDRAQSHSVKSPVFAAGVGTINSHFRRRQIWRGRWLRLLGWTFLSDIGNGLGHKIQKCSPASELVISDPDHWASMFVPGLWVWL